MKALSLGMAQKKKSQSLNSRTKILLQEHFSKPLGSYQMGAVDCCSWVADYVNDLIGEDVVKLDKITQGEAARRLRLQPLAKRVEEFMKALGWEKVKDLSKLPDGAVICFLCDSCFSGQGVGLASGGEVYSRIHSESLTKHKKEEIEIISAWEK